MKDVLTSSKNKPVIPSFTIMPDFGGAYIWDNRLETREEPEFTAMALAANKVSKKFPKELLADFVRWQSYFEDNAFEERTLRTFDWRWFHSQGILLSVRLKEVCGNSARVIYEKPFEDPNVKLNERREVLIDGQLIDA